MLLAFQGEERVVLERPYGHDVRLEAYRLPPQLVAAELRRTGLDVHARVVREPVEPEKSRRAYVMARKTAGQS